MDSAKLPNDNKFNIRILKCGQENCDPHKVPEADLRPYNSLHLIIYGKGHLKFGNEEKELKQGNAFLLYDGEEYTYYPDEHDPWSYIWVDFIGTGTEELFAACGLSKKRPWVQVENFKKLRGDFERLVDAFYKDDMLSFTCLGHFLIVIGQLFENAEKNQSEERPSKKSAYVREALVYINNNYRLNLTVDSIARNVHISSSYLMSLFTSEIGMTVVEYINQYRIAYACVFLKIPGIKIGEVANMVGYSDSLYFSRVFSKIKGMNPRQYIARDIKEDSFAFLKEKEIDCR